MKERRHDLRKAVLYLAAQVHIAVLYLAAPVHWFT
jgi:hypothetical protein